MFGICRNVREQCMPFAPAWCILWFPKSVKNSHVEPSILKALYTQELPYEIYFYMIYTFPFFFALVGKLANLSTGMFWHLSIIYDNMSGGKTTFANKREQNMERRYFWCHWEVVAKESICWDKDKAILIFDIRKDATMTSFNPYCQTWF